MKYAALALLVLTLSSGSPAPHYLMVQVSPRHAQVGGMLTIAVTVDVPTTCHIRLQRLYRAGRAHTFLSMRRQHMRHVTIRLPLHRAWPHNEVITQCAALVARAQFAVLPRHPR